MLAPEGSEERVAARAVLVRSAAVGIRIDGMSAVEWRALVSEHMPETVAAVGAHDMNCIVRFTLGKGR